MAAPEPTQPPPLFTVVMPAYQAAGTIAIALRSVLAQTEQRFELIVVDDGSPDDRATVAEAAASGDPRVRIIRQRNSGPASARNLGIASGKAPFVAFLDADDRWSPDLLARHHAHFRSDFTLGVSFARVCLYDATLTQPGRISAHVADLHLAHVMGENPACTTSNLVARRDVFRDVGGFDATLTHAEDQEWIARVLSTSAWCVRGLDAVLVDYRTSTAGLSADLERMQAGWRLMIERVRSYAPHKATAAERQASALFERYLARRALRTGQPAWRACAHLLAAIRHSPRTLITHSPKRTALTIAGVFAAAILPASLVRAAITR